MIVMSAPLFNDDPRLLQAVEDFAVEQFVAQLAVEAFAIAVLPRTARCNEQSFCPDLSEPIPDNLGGHLGAVVGPNISGDALSQHHIGKGLDDTEARDPSRHPDRKALTGVFVDQRQQTERSAIMRLC